MEYYNWRKIWPVTGRESVSNENLNPGKVHTLELDALVDFCQNGRFICSEWKMLVEFVLNMECPKERKTRRRSINR